MSSDQSNQSDQKTTETSTENTFMVKMTDTELVAFSKCIINNYLTEAYKMNREFRDIEFWEIDKRNAAVAILNAHITTMPTINLVGEKFRCEFVLCHGGAVKFMVVNDQNDQNDQK